MVTSKSFLQINGLHIMNKSSTSCAELMVASLIGFMFALASVADLIEAGTLVWAK